MARSATAGRAHRGAHYRIVAATAIATKRTVLTTDRNARFDELPDVNCIVLT